MRLNMQNGDAISLGHPIGATCAGIVTALLKDWSGAGPATRYSSVVLCNLLDSAGELANHNRGVSIDLAGWAEL